MLLNDFRLQNTYLFPLNKCEIESFVLVLPTLPVMPTNLEFKFDLYIFARSIRAL